MTRLEIKELLEKLYQRRSMYVGIMQNEIKGAEPAIRCYAKIVAIDRRIDDLNYKLSKSDCT